MTCAQMVESTEIMEYTDNVTSVSAEVAMHVDY